MDQRYARLLDIYWDSIDRWRASLLDVHTAYHGGLFDTCRHHRCHEYHWAVREHGRVPRPDFRQR